MGLDSSARSSSTDNRQYQAVICASCSMFFFFAVIFALLSDSEHSKDDHSLSCPLSNVDCTALFKSKARNCCKTLCLPLLSKCALTSYSVPLIFIRKLFSCSVHNSFMLHLIVPVRAAAEISDNVHMPSLPLKTDKNFLEIFMNANLSSKNRSVQPEIQLCAPVCFDGANIEFFA